jgi:adenylosuccinate synthase
MITIVVGAQYGGEGKGKICSYLGFVAGYRYVCRTGGVNSSHTVRYGNHFHKLRMMPASAVVSDSTFLFGAGSLIHIDTLLREMECLSIAPSQVVIDPQAGIVTADCVEAQRRDPRYQHLGSTLTGTGYATAARGMRKLKLARDYTELRGHLGDVSGLLFDATQRGQAVLVEGHQAMGLSNYHGDYPYTSSRDCTAAALLSEIGVGPRVDMDIILVVKMFPTRNHEGRLPNELTIEEADDLGIREFGGGAWGLNDQRRRVARLDWPDIHRAVRLNSPTCVALTGLDHAFPECRGARTPDELSPGALAFVEEFERRIGVPIGVISTGPDVVETVALESRFKPGRVEQSARRPLG